MIWVEFAKNYLGAFAAKDIDYLESVYNDNVVLSDWGGFTQGKDAVISLNKSFFEFSGDISIHIQNTSYRDKYVSLEFIMQYGGNVVNVVDIIEIDDYGKIKSIRAYKQ